MTMRHCLIALFVVIAVAAIRLLLVPHFIMATAGETNKTIADHFEVADGEPESDEVAGAVQRTILDRGDWIINFNLALDAVLLVSLIALFVASRSLHGIDARMINRTERTRS